MVHPMAADVHTVLVESALTRVDVLNAVREDAAKVDGAALVDEAATADDLAALVLREGIRASVRHMAVQVRDSITSVKAEMDAVRKADPATLRSVTDQEIAARKVEKIREAEG